MKERVFLMSHGITSVTGFANQVWLISRALIEDGYDVYAIHKDYRGEPLICGKGTKTASGRTLNGLTILPWGGAPWMEDKLQFYVDEYKPDYVFTLGDIWCYQYISQMKRSHDWKWIAHYVFDTENVISPWDVSLRNADLCVVPAKFALDMVRKRGHKNVFYIPHGVDTKIFTPATADEKSKLREEIKFPDDTFVISCVSHNQVRKMMDRLLKSFEIFSHDKKNTRLYMHTQMRDQTGWDLGQMVIDWDILDKVYFTDKAAKQLADVHVSEMMLRNYYVTSDVHATASGGEGFGVPLVEAMACGLPNVTTAYTTTNEFLSERKEENGQIYYEGVRGVPVPYLDLIYHPTGGLWAHVDMKKMAEAFQYLYENPSEGHILGTRARKFAVENYDIEVVKKYWKEFFATIPEKIEGLKEFEPKGLRPMRIQSHG